MSLIFVVRFRFPVLGAFAAPVVFLIIGYAAMQSKEVRELISRVVAPVDLLPSSDKVLPVINDDNTITLMNLTQEELPVVRVFYKYFYEDENTFVGGITYTATAQNIPAGGSVTVAPSHFEANASLIMGTGVYEQ